MQIKLPALALFGTCALLTQVPVFAQSPGISSWSPSHAAPGAVVSIAGKNLSTTKSITINGVPGIVSNASDWSAQVTVPAGATTGPVTVTNAYGSYTASVNFTVDGGTAPTPTPTPTPTPPPPTTAAAPTISSFTPGQAMTGTQISISGTSLSTTNAVYFNGTLATGLSVGSDFGVTATVPSGATTGPIKIVTAGGSYSTSTSFKVIPPPPSISSWSPSDAPVGGVVTIAGKNLQTTSSIAFNGVLAAAMTVNSDWSVTVTIPAGATTGPVTITSSGGSYTPSVNFTVDGPSNPSPNPSPTPSPSPAPGPTSSFISPPAIDPPAGSLTGHPRIFVRQTDLTRLQNWALQPNPIWSDLQFLAETRRTAWDAGTVGTDSGNGYSGFVAIETDAELFAFVSMVHPDPTQRAGYARRAHDIVMTIFNAAAKGQATGQPYRGPEFAVSNRANWYGESYATVIDWAYSTFTPQEKATIRQVFLRWIQENLIVTGAGDHPRPVGVINDPTLVSSQGNVRESTNNYYANHGRQIGLMSMALDAEDDVPATPSDPPAGTLRRYLANAIGAWLYVQNQYEQTAGLGGIEPEGMAYGEISERAWAFLLLAMHTTGTDNPQVYGPQAAMFGNDYWTKGVVNSTLHMLSPALSVLNNRIGQSYQPYSFSDNATYQPVDQVRVLGPLAMVAMDAGDTATYSKLRWMIDNLTPGGLAYRDKALKGAYLYIGSLSSPIFYFLSVDPNIAAGTDPRSAQPTDYFAPGTGVLLSRTGWTPDSSWFTYKLTWNQIDHQHGDGNAIGFYRGGEWLTMPAAGYGADIGSSDYQNTLAIQNPGNSTDQFWQPNQTRGSQWIYDPNGDPSAVTHSQTAAYTFAQGDATNLYNNPAIAALDVLHASRSVLWLKPDVIVVYDRATTGVAGHFKRFHLNTPTLAAVNGRSASVATPGGQQLFLDALLPANASLTAVARENLPSQPAAGDPMPFRLWSEDLNLPADVRFLNVLQGANGGGSKQPVALIQSSAGTPFDGAVVGSIAVMFRHDITSVFTSVTFTVPAGVAQTYVTGLTPGAAYTVEKTGNQYSVTPGGPLTADAGGALSFVF